MIEPEPAEQEPTAFRGGINSKVVADRDHWKARALKAELFVSSYRAAHAIVGLVVFMYFVCAKLPEWWNSFNAAPHERLVDASVAYPPLQTMQQEVYEIYTFVIPIRLWWVMSDREFDPATIGRVRREQRLPTMLDAVGVCSRRGRCMCPAAHIRVRAFRARPATWRSNNTPMLN